MHTLSLDLETFSPTNLATAGVYRYAEDEAFRILLLGYSIDGAPAEVIDLARGEPIPPEILQALTDPTVTKSAFNAAFERVCLSAYLRHHHPDLLAKGFLDPRGWRCTMVWAASLGLPMSLDSAAKALRLPIEKDPAGQKLIRRFSIPGKDGNRVLPGDDPVGWQQYIAYNRRDVDVEVQLASRLTRNPMLEVEWETYWLDQRINDTGVRIDTTLAAHAVEVDTRHRDTCIERAQQLTGLENPNSPIKLKDWLAEHDCELESLTKTEVETALETASGDVAEVLRLRQDLSKSSVKKYQAMLAVAGSDDRARGLIQYMGAGRTGRFAGRLIQVQNLPRNHMPDLATARSLLAAGDSEALEMLYTPLPDTLSQLIRTAFIPSEGHRFIVADFSAIEARVLAWLAGEDGTLQAFREGKDLYCQTASRMFGVPVEKHGANAELRQKGKIAVLACIAEGQLVTTPRGDIPIEHITTDDLVWDGTGWVSHQGLIFKGVRDVITYQGLTATPDHLVWVQGQANPVPLRDAAASGAHLLRTQPSRPAIRMGRDHQPTKTVESVVESLLYGNPVHRLRQHPVDQPQRTKARKNQGLPAMLHKRQALDPQMAGPSAHCSQAAMQQPKRPTVGVLRRAWNRIQVCFGARGRALDSGQPAQRVTETGARPDRHQRSLRAGKPQICFSLGQHRQPSQHCAQLLGTEVLAVCPQRGHQEVVSRAQPAGHHRGCTQSGAGKAESVAAHSGKARVYDLRNAGPRHRFTVSGILVHNCGYGGSVGALKAMGALRMGLEEHELKPLVDAWRDANPAVVQFWHDIEQAAITTVETRTPTQVGRIRLSYRSGCLFIRLPSGRELCYPRPRLGENRFGMTSILFDGVDGTTRKWAPIETYGGKLTENLVQATARDLLTHAMHHVDTAGHRIVMHIHDEIVVDEPTTGASVEDIVALMTRLPTWAGGLPLDADGYECAFYMKD